MITFESVFLFQNCNWQQNEYIFEFNIKKYAIILYYGDSFYNNTSHKALGTNDAI